MRTGIPWLSADSWTVTNTYTSPERASEYDAGNVRPFTVTVSGEKVQVLAVVLVFMGMPRFLPCWALSFLVAERLALPTQRT